jgi:hypothetical protein
MKSDQEHRKSPHTRGVVTLAVSGVAVLALVLGFVPMLEDSPPEALPPTDGTVTIDLDETVNEFDGTKDLGAGVDGLEKGEIDLTWTPEKVQAMGSAGFGPISYRLRTELGSNAWHWNPRGTWSEPGSEQGYWVSDAEPVEDYGVSYGYQLPRRGNTIDQAKNNGYSRLSDGDTESFWKSNPYLDSHFTGEPDDRNPQWVMVAFPGPVPVDTLRFDWGTPHATRFKVQYWTGKDAHFPIEGGDWKDFPQGEHQGAGGVQEVRIAPEAQSVQFVRIVLLEDSDTAPEGSTDVRDRLGFAIRELYVGQQVGGAFVDHMSHEPSKEQTEMWTSSTDPWHRAEDLDPNHEHASFERLFESGITKGEPMMVPVPALYGVPEDAAALVTYLRKRGYPVEQIEIGEEPDGQLAEPEHYGALYLQMADAIKAVDPSLEFGGPGYQTTLPDWVHWPDEEGNQSWTGRFVGYLRERDRMEDFDFFSFEWYPFDDVCGNTSAQLAEHPQLLKDLMRRQHEAGLPPDVPKVITEYGFSAFAGQVELELPGAMVNAESAAMFFEMGGDASYYYGLEPNWVFQEKEGEPCDSWGNLMMLQFYDEWKIRPLPAYRAARMVTETWVQGTEEHLVYPTSTDVQNDKGQDLVTAYSVRRPDGTLGVLLFNKDPERSITVRLEQSSGDGSEVVPGPLTVEQYSSKQYRWHSTQGVGNGGHPDPNDPPETIEIPAEDGATVTLPPQSISVAATRED